MQPAHEPVSSLIYSASERAIRHVYVDGTQVVKDGKVLTVDVEAATAGLIEGQRKRLKTVAAARLGRPHRRPARTAGLRHEGSPAAVEAGDVMGHCWGRATPVARHVPIEAKIAPLEWRAPSA